MRWFWFVISLMSNDVEHLFKCSSAICVSPLEKGLFRCFFTTSLVPSHQAVHPASMLPMTACSPSKCSSSQALWLLKLSMALHCLQSNLPICVLWTVFWESLREVPLKMVAVWLWPRFQEMPHSVTNSKSLPMHVGSATSQSKQSPPQPNGFDYRFTPLLIFSFFFFFFTVFWDIIHI